MFYLFNESRLAHRQIISCAWKYITSSNHFCEIFLQIGKQNMYFLESSTV